MFTIALVLIWAFLYALDPSTSAGLLVAFFIVSIVLIIKVWKEIEKEVKKG
jgi:hypothetical protein